MQTYLASADPTLSGFYGPAGFTRNLALNLLFREPQLVVPDSYCFSPPAFTHVVASPKEPSLLQQAIQHSLVVPIFRDRGASTFQEILSQIRLQRIHTIHEDAVLTATRLQRAADKNENFRPQYYKTENVSLEYKHLVAQLLTTEKMPPVLDVDSREAEDKREFWQSTRWLRTKVLESAFAMRDRDLRRADIRNAIAWELGMSRETEWQDTARVIHEAWDQSTALGRQVSAFWRWISYCYYVNHARHCTHPGTEVAGTSSTFPLCDAYGGIFISNLAPSKAVGSSRATHSFRTEAIIPDVDKLATLSPAKLLNLRMDQGVRYFDAVSAWLETPSPTLQQIVKDELTAYAMALCETARSPGQTRASLALASDAVDSGAMLSEMVLKSPSSGVLGWIGEAFGAGVAVLAFLSRQQRAKMVPFSFETNAPESCQTAELTQLVRPESLPSKR